MRRAPGATKFLSVGNLEFPKYSFSSHQRSSWIFGKYLSRQVQVVTEKHSFFFFSSAFSAMILFFLCRKLDENTLEKHGHLDFTGQFPYLQYGLSLRMQADTKSLALTLPEGIGEINSRLLWQTRPLAHSLKIRYFLCIVCFQLVPIVPLGVVQVSRKEHFSEKWRLTLGCFAIGELS